MERGQHLDEPLDVLGRPGGGRVPENRGGAFSIPVEDEPPDVIGEVEFQEFQHQSFMPDCVVCFLNVQEGYVSFLLLTSQVMIASCKTNAVWMQLVLGLKPPWRGWMLLIWVDSRDRSSFSNSLLKTGSRV
jgi:hypothetical protein